MFRRVSEFSPLRFRWLRARPSTMAVFQAREPRPRWPVGRLDWSAPRWDMMAFFCGPKTLLEPCLAGCFPTAHSQTSRTPSPRALRSCEKLGSPRQGIDGRIVSTAPPTRPLERRVLPCGTVLLDTVPPSRDFDGPYSKRDCLQMP